MKRSSTALLAILLFSSPAWAYQIKLSGKLVTDSKKPVPNTRIGVAGRQGGVTGADGGFSIDLSNDMKEGERVIIVVEKKGWVINYPLDGEWNLPNRELQRVQTLDVIIVPLGSKALWTNARIEKHIARLSDEIAKLKKEGTERKPIDFTFYLNEWASQYGFTPQEVKDAFDEWAKAAEQSEDYKTIGLREFYKKNFALAAMNFGKAAVQEEAKLKRLQEQTERTTLNAYEDWKLKGNSESNAYNFRDAVASYDWAIKLVPREKYTSQWAEAAFLIGNAKQDLGIRAEGEEGQKMLAEAVTAFRQSLSVYTRQQLSQAWAMTQNNLGAVLRDQATRVEGSESVRLLAEAVAAFRHALEVRTREQLPQDWAVTQNNLAGVLFYLKDWENAAKCYANVLQLYPNQEEAYQRASYIYHEVLFSFQQAFELNQAWVDRHTGDLSALSDFAEKHFTTGKFDQCRQRVTALLADAQLDIRIKVALRAIEIADLLALNQPGEVPAKMTALIEALNGQPAAFKVGWSFAGTKHFISQNDKLAARRDFLQQLFAAMEGDNQQAIINGLKAAAARFNAPQ